MDGVTVRGSGLGMFASDGHPAVPVALTLRSGQYRLGRFLGEGGEGTVHEILPVDPGHPPLALKWYFPWAATPRKRETIHYLVERGAPSSNFLWPLELATAVDDSFGYVMPLRPADYVVLSDLFVAAYAGGPPRVDVSFATLCMLGLELTDSFSQLHAEGLCYRDISFNNIFFDPATGRPLVCDNDNVGIDGGSSSVLGTRRFMAPEIVRGEAVPSSDTDRWSLAVLLFYLLMVGHPLLGRRELAFSPWDEDAEMEMFGRAPLFLFDPADTSNRPDPALHASVIANWGVMPGHIRSLFTQAFTAGVTDPQHGRVRESVWRVHLARLRDSIVNCPSCGRQSFVDADAPDTVCWSCSVVIPDSLRLEFDAATVRLSEDAIVCSHHVNGDFNYTTPVAEVVRRDANREQWGLRNGSDQTWTARLPNGRELQVAPGQALGLVVDTELDLGGSTAYLRK